MDQNIVYKNLQALTRYQPGLAEKVMGGDRGQISVFKSKKGEAIVKINDISLHSNYDAASEARTLISKYDVRGKELVIVLGLGFAYHIREIVKSSPNAKIIIIEKNVDLLKAAVESIDLEDLLAQTILLVDVDATEISNDQRIKQIVTPNYLIVEHPASVRTHPVYYHQTADIVKRLCRSGQETISAVVQTLNEEENIEACLKSLLWADEIIVCDENSKDRTVEICQRFTDKIYTKESGGVVECNRNFAISQASSDWVLVVDADERIPAELAGKIRQAIKNNPQADVILLPRRNLIFGKIIEHAGWGNDYPIRLFRRGKVTWLPFVHVMPKVEGNVMQLDLEDGLGIIHYNYHSISQFLEKMNRYTTAEAAQRLAQMDRPEFDSNALLKGMCEEFSWRYLDKEGFKDGEHGFILSLLMSFYYFLTYAKIWEMRTQATGLSDATGEQEGPCVQRGAEAMKYTLHRHK